MAVSDDPRDGPLAHAFRQGSRTGEFKLLIASKLFDAATTAIGLVMVPFAIERNRTARALIADLGLVPGLLLGSVVVVATVFLVTELGVWATTRSELSSGWGAHPVRTIGYVTLSLIFLAAGLNNSVLVLGAL